MIELLNFLRTNKAILFFITYLLTTISMIISINKICENLDSKIRIESKQNLTLYINNTVDYRFRWSQNLLVLFRFLMGNNHFSLKCFLFSSLASYFSLCLIRILYLSLNKDLELFNFNAWIIILCYSFFTNILFDYFSLLETRWIMSKMNDSSKYFVVESILLLLLDLFLTGFISYVSISFVVFIFKDHQLLPLNISPLISFNMPQREQNIFSVWWYTAFSTSVWVWLYFTSIYLSKIFNFVLVKFGTLSKIFDIEKNPFGYIGWNANIIVIVSFLTLALLQW